MYGSHNEETTLIHMRVMGMKAWEWGVKEETVMNKILGRKQTWKADPSYWATHLEKEEKEIFQKSSRSLECVLVNVKGEKNSDTMMEAYFRPPNEEEEVDEVVSKQVTGVSKISEITGILTSLTSIREEKQHIICPTHS